MSNTIKYVQPNSYISTINTKMAEISRKMSRNITFVDQNKIDDIMSKATDLKASMGTVKSKITNNEDIADSYFENVLNHLEDCYQLIMTNVIEVYSGSSGSGGTACQLDTSEIEYLKALVQAIPAFPEGFVSQRPTVKANADKIAEVPDALPNTLSNANWISTYNAVSSIPSGFSTDWSTVKTNSAKVANVPDALPNTLSSANWTSTYNAVSGIPTGFAVDWNKICLITKSDLTTTLTNCISKLDGMETILGDIVLE
jgi:hypothetical protein